MANIALYCLTHNFYNFTFLITDGSARHPLMKNKLLKSILKLTNNKLGKIKSWILSQGIAHNSSFVPQFMGKSNPYMENIKISHHQDDG